MPPTFDHALELYRCGRPGSARAELLELLQSDPRNRDAWSLLGYIQRDIGDAAASAEAFDRALSLNADDATALNGRARIALERAESGVFERYERALANSSGDPRLTLEFTEARIERGDDAAIDEFADFVARHPDWTEGQVALARMRWESHRDPDFTKSIRALLTAVPRRAGLWQALIALLSEVDAFAEAADVARDARAVLGNLPEILLSEATNAGHAGQIERADALFARVPPTPQADSERALHLLRRGDLVAAREAVERSLAGAPDSIRAWATAELVYRTMGDPRAEWLSGQPGLVQVLELPLDSAQLANIRDLLLSLHRTGVQAVGQSVREGTQTRWRLFDRPEPELAELKRTLGGAIADYVSGLPPRDEHHPLLRHRDSPLAITGSWSVRLTGRGRHISHVHPLGLIGSACYFIVPDGVAASQEGYLELGRPPPELQSSLEPLHVIEPKPGRLVLFPSYLHHGTRPFSAGERLSVAFDVARDPAAD